MEVVESHILGTKHAITPKANKIPFAKMFMMVQKVDRQNRAAILHECFIALAAEPNGGYGAALI